MASIDSLNSTFKAFNVNSANCLQSSVVKKQNPYHKEQQESYSKKQEKLAKQSGSLKIANALCFASSVLLITSHFAAKKIGKTPCNNVDKLKNLKLLNSALFRYLLKAVAFVSAVIVIAKSSAVYSLRKSMYEQTQDVKKHLKFDDSVSPKVAVIDDYSQKTIRIDSDRIPDMVHGVAVEAFIKSELPNAQITRMSTTYDESSVKNALAYVLNCEEKYDAINLSKSSDISYKELSKFIGMKVSPQNVALNKDEIKKRFFTSKHQDAQELKEIITSLEKIAANGTKIYIASGNKGNKNFNLYTLADGVNVVGATKKYGKIAPYSACNTLVTSYERGSFRINKVKDENGQLGFDITQNGKPDIMAAETTSKVKKAIFDLYGTSFAAPQALARDFKKSVN